MEDIRTYKPLVCHCSEQFDSFFERRVGRKEGREAAGGEGIGNVEMSGRLRGTDQGTGLALDFFEGPREAVGEAGEERARSVGEEFAFPGDGQRNEPRDDRGKHYEYESEDEERVAAAIAIVAAAAAEPAHPEKHVCEKRDGANQEHDYSHHPDVIVFDVGQLVREHALQLFVF